MTKDDQPAEATPKATEEVPFMGTPAPAAVPAATTPIAPAPPAPAPETLPGENAPSSFEETRGWYHQTLATTEALRLELAGLREDITQLKGRVETVEAHNTEVAMHPPAQG